MTHLEDSHAAWREMLALRLYDELEPAEAARLERHLAGCDACAAFAAELAHGLGRAAADASTTNGMPPDWRERIVAVTRTPHRGTGGRLTVFAAGLAAGLAIMALAGGRGAGPGAAENGDAPIRYATNASRELGAETLALDAPPPAAVGRAYAGFGGRLR